MFIPIPFIERQRVAPSCFSFLLRVKIKHDGDNKDEQDFEEGEVLGIKAVGLVAGVLVEDKGAEQEANRQPDDLSLGVPHERYS